MDTINNPMEENKMKAYEAEQLDEIRAALDEIESSGLPTGGTRIKGKPTAIVSVATVAGSRFAVTVRRGNSKRAALKSAGFVRDGFYHVWRANVGDFAAAVSLAAAVGINLYRC